MVKSKFNLKILVSIFATKSGAGQRGSALIISLVFMLIILIVVTALLGYVSQNVNSTRRAVASEQAMALAEAGVDQAISQLNATAGAYTGETDTALSTGVFDVSVETITLTLKEITATGYAPDKASPKGERQVKVRVSINTTSVSFNYGVQVGNGGMVMDNNTSIDGNVYSNGTIDGGQNAVITGDAFSAGAAGRIFDRLEIGGNAHAHQIDSDVEIAGNAYAYAIDDVQVTGDAFAYSLNDCDIEGDASYTTESGCTIDGAEITPYPGEADPAAEPFPLTDEQIQDWKDAAAAGDTISGNYTIPLGTTESLGPIKITGNLIVDQLATLTLTGPIYVVGNITTYNNSHVALDPAYDNSSEVIISDGVIDAVNNTFFDRAGPESYIMMVTTKSGDDVFKVANRVDALIVYAANGEIEVLNRAILREVTGYKIHINQLAEVTYESGLANINFTGGPGASWQIQRGTWREIK